MSNANQYRDAQTRILRLVSREKSFRNHAFQALREEWCWRQNGTCNVLMILDGIPEQVNKKSFF
jgi:hypothetical protein